MEIIYILTNESMPGSIKIGTTQDLPRRIKELDTTSTPLPFECFYALGVEDGRGSEIEKQLHEALDDKRVRPNREFFNCLPEQAKSALKIAETMGGKDVTPTESIVETAQDKQALDAAKRTKGRINYFGILGINIGEKLTFAKDINVTCEVSEDGKVLFEGELTTLSNSALTVISNMGYDWPRISGPNYWCYQGTTLADLYKQAQDT